MNVQMRIVTEDNVDQLLSMNYSNNINKLLHTDKNITESIKEINENITTTLRKSSRLNINNEAPVLPEPVNVVTPESPTYQPNGPQSDAVSPAYIPEESTKSTPDYYERKENENGTIQVQPKYNYPDDLGYYYINLSEQEKQSLLNKPFEEKVAYLRDVKAKKEKELAEKTTPISNILEVEHAKPEEKVASEQPASESAPSEKKPEPAAESSSESTSSDGTRKIIL
jgi:hypothetical protein